MPFWFWDQYYLLPVGGNAEHTQARSYQCWSMPMTVHLAVSHVGCNEQLKGCLWFLVVRVNHKSKKMQWLQLIANQSQGLLLWKNFSLFVINYCGTPHKVCNAGVSTLNVFLYKRNSTKTLGKLIRPIHKIKFRMKKYLWIGLCTIVSFDKCLLVTCLSN